MSDPVEFPDPSTRKGGRPWVGKRNDLVEVLRARRSMPEIRINAAPYWKRSARRHPRPWLGAG